MNKESFLFLVAQIIINSVLLHNLIEIKANTGHFTVSLSMHFLQINQHMKCTKKNWRLLKHIKCTRSNYCKLTSCIFMNGGWFVIVCVKLVVKH